MSIPSLRHRLENAETYYRILLVRYRNGDGSVTRERLERARENVVEIRKELRRRLKPGRT